MSDVVSFIRARLDEHAETARLAIGINGAAAVRLHQQGSAAAANYPLPVWSYDAGQVWKAGSTPTVVVGQTWHREGEHIALNDPVHVLAWVAAARYVLDIVEGCVSAAAILTGVAPGTAEECEMRGKADVGRHTALTFAAVWRTHPDYDPAWTPDHRHDFGPDRDQSCPCGYPAPPF